MGSEMCIRDRGTILSDKNYTDRRDNNGDGEAGSPYIFDDKNDNTWYDDGEGYTRWDTDDLSQFADPLDSAGIDAVLGAIADGLDNDGDSDDYDDLNGNGMPDYVDSDGSGEFERGEMVEPGVQWLG